MKVDYVVHDESGTIVRGGKCDDSIVDLQHCGEPGLSVLQVPEPVIPLEEYEVRDGQVVKIATL